MINRKWGKRTLKNTIIDMFGAEQCLSATVKINQPEKILEMKEQKGTESLER